MPIKDADLAQKSKEEKNQNIMVQWSQYLTWIQSFSHVPCRLKNGKWYNRAKILEVSASEEWRYLPVKIQVPGADGPTNAWVGLQRLGLHDLHRLRPSDKAGRKVANRVDLSCLQPGMQVQALQYDDKWYAADVLQISTSKLRIDAPVKVHYRGHPEEAVDWLGVECLRSKALAHLKKPVALDDKPMKAKAAGHGKLTIGMKLQAWAEDGVWYATEIVSVSKSQIKVHYFGYAAMHDEWVSMDRLRSKVLKGRP